METTNGILSGLMVPAKPVPDMRYPHYKKWYRTVTPLSSDIASYQGHSCAAGRNILPTFFANRRWDEDTPPARTEVTFSATTAMDITTPFNLLASTLGSVAGVEDTLIGPDYYNLPLRLNQDLIGINATSPSTVDNQQSLYIRVCAIKHRFTYVNYSRFPLQIFYCVLPVNYAFNVLSTLVATMDIMDDMSGHSSFKSITVPPVRDAGDRSKKSTIDFGQNLKMLFPDNYSIPPGPQMTGVSAGASTNSQSPWISVKPGSTTTNVTQNIWPGQIQDDLFSTPAFASSAPIAGLKFVWYAKLQNPRDLGVTADASGTAGDYAGNNYDVIADCSWQVEIIRPSSYDAIHTGEKAYPSQVA